MFDLTEEIDELRTHSLEWLLQERASLKREQRRLHLRELAVTRVLDERGAIDDSLAATDGVSVRDVREAVEVARALESLPHLAAAAHAGLLSDGQLNAATRLADEASDAEWAERAPNCAPADLQRMVRAQHTPTAEESRRRWESRELRTWWDRRTKMLHGRFALPDLQGAEFESVIEQVVERMRPAKGQPWELRHRRAADALVALARRAAGDDTTIAAGITPKVVVNIPVGGPAEIAGGVLLANETVEQLRANATIEVAVVDDDGVVIGISRATHALSPKVQRAVRARDGQCRWPGCTARSNLEVHHLVPRSWGGTDDFANLASVCTMHHRQLVPHGLHVLTGVPSVPGGLTLERLDRTSAGARAGP
ncbi:MAG: HNH endonuclease signature motif containing protein [Actinomycetes bacterium]